MKVLFICGANVGRSQMAEALFANLAPHHQSFSAGIDVVPEREAKPVSFATKKVIETMRQVGVDVSGKIINQLTPDMVEDADKIIVMAPESDLPEYLKNSPKLEAWDIPDAGGKDLEFHHKVRDMIKEKVEELAKRLD